MGRSGSRPWNPSSGPVPEPAPEVAVEVVGGDEVVEVDEVGVEAAVATGPAAALDTTGPAETAWAVLPVAAPTRPSWTPSTPSPSSGVF